MDITKCKGIGCDIKSECHRFAAETDVYWQSYFVESPIKNGKCDLFWGEQAQSIFNQLLDITKQQDNEQGNIQTNKACS
jgi:hypothetical protein